MRRLIFTTTVALALELGPDLRAARAQVSLADDIIAAATQGKENARQRERSSLGRRPGTSEIPYRRSPGSSDVVLGGEPARRFTPLPRLTRRPSNPAGVSVPPSTPDPREHGLAPSIEQLPGTPSLPPGGAGDVDTMEDEEGPAWGVDLDAAIDRLIRCSRDLRTKFFEIPQAEADVLTAGLRENPLLFYSSGGVPYGSYAPNRPGEITHGLSLVYPLDYSGKRRTKVEVARLEKLVLEAQYLDAVRLQVDALYTAFVDVVAARQAWTSAVRGLGQLDSLSRDAQARPADGPDALEERDDLAIERDLAAMSTGDEHSRYDKARRRLALLLDLAPGEVDAFEVRGSLRSPGTEPPPVDVLIRLALDCRPDLLALRRGVERAQAEQSNQRAERFSDAYLLYTPFEYHDNSQNAQLNSTSWGAGLFVSAPLFNRNQGNLRRARLNIDQSRNELAAVERLVIAEVDQAVRDLENTREDLIRLEGTTLPAIRRKRDRARARLQSGEIAPTAFLAIQRDSTSLVRYHRETLARHRRNSLKLNTAVGHRVLP
jgi:cobalt-zinc-cadmium efflux system outer membrane protein